MKTLLFATLLLATVTVSVQAQRTCYQKITNRNLPGWDMAPMQYKNSLSECHAWARGYSAKAVVFNWLNQCYPKGLPSPWFVETFTNQDGWTKAGDYDVPGFDHSSWSRSTAGTGSGFGGSSGIGSGLGVSSSYQTCDMIVKNLTTEFCKVLPYDQGTDTYMMISSSAAHNGVTVFCQG